jgi:hypothetical protein
MSPCDIEKVTYLRNAQDFLKGVNNADDKREANR